MRLEALVDTVGGDRLSDRGPLARRGPAPPAAGAHVVGRACSWPSPTVGRPTSPGCTRPWWARRGIDRRRLGVGRRLAAAAPTRSPIARWKGPSRLSSAAGQEQPDGSTHRGAPRRLRRPLGGHRAQRAQSRQSSFAGRRLDRRRVLLHPRTQARRAPTPTRRRPGGTARAAGRARRTSCSSATTSRSPPWCHDEAGPEVARAGAAHELCVVRPRPGARVRRARVHDRSGMTPRRRGRRLGLRPPGPSHFALALRRAGATLVMDLHPDDRGPQGTYGGAICATGTSTARRRPRRSSTSDRSPAGSSADEVAAHDHKTAELARYKLGRIGGADADGYSPGHLPGPNGQAPLPPAAHLHGARPDTP